MKILAVIQDTFRECSVKKILLLFFIFSTLGILGVLSIFNIDIVENSVKISSLFFKGEETASLDTFEEVIIKIEAFLAMALFTAGLFLSVFATADLTPSLMSKGRLDLYLSRPISRSQLLIAKYLGALSVTAVNIIYAIGGFWLVIGLKTGVWNVNFLYSGLNIIFMFSVLYAFIMLIGIFIRSTSAIIILIYLLITLSPILAQRNEIFHFVNSRFVECSVNILYWVTPKYYEMSLVTKDLVGGGSIPSWTPVLASLVLAIVVMNISMFLFSKKNC